MIAEDHVDRMLRLLLRSDADGDQVEAEAKEIAEFLVGDQVPELMRRLLESGASEQQISDVYRLIAAVEERGQKPDALELAQIETTTAHDVELARLVIGRWLPEARGGAALPEAFRTLPKVDPDYAEHLAADPIWDRLGFPVRPWAERGVTPLTIYQAIRALAMYVDRLTTPQPNWVAWPRVVLLLDPGDPGDARRHRVPRRIAAGEIRSVVECAEGVADALLSFLTGCASKEPQLFDNLVVVSHSPKELIVERDLYAQAEPTKLGDVAAYYRQRWGLSESRRPEYKFTPAYAAAEDGHLYVAGPEPSSPRIYVPDIRTPSKRWPYAIAASIVAVAIIGVSGGLWIEPQRRLDRLADMNIRVDESRVDFPRGASQKDLETAISLIKGIGPIKPTERVTVLQLANTQISDLTPLQDLPDLEVLDFADTKVSDVAPLAKLQNLRSINMDNTLVSDLDSIKNLDKLTALDLGRTPIEELAQLNKFDNLQWLDLSHTAIVEFPYLSGLKSLQKLDLESTYIKDVSPLAKLPALKCLNLAHTDVSDISPLMALPSLKLLDLRGTQVTQDQVDVLRQKNTSIEVYMSAEPGDSWHNCPPGPALSGVG